MILIFATTVTHFSRVRGCLVDSLGRQGIRPTISWMSGPCSLSPQTQQLVPRDKWLTEPQSPVTEGANTNNGIRALPLLVSSQMFMVKSLTSTTTPPLPVPLENAVK